MKRFTRLEVLDPMFEPLRVDASVGLAPPEDREQRWIMLLFALEEQADSVEVDPLALRMAKQQAANNLGRSREKPLTLPERRHRCRHP
ncbi:MAG: hypothetical protein RMN53_16640 [Anaerolineae bacterium]|nr:hypothetical protein [Anaerolineae bacterium]